MREGGAREERPPERESSGRSPGSTAWRHSSGMSGATWGAKAGATHGIWPKWQTSQEWGERSCPCSTATVDATRTLHARIRQASAIFQFLMQPAGIVDYPKYSKRALGGMTLLYLLSESIRSQFRARAPSQREKYEYIESSDH